MIFFTRTELFLWNDSSEWYNRQKKRSVANIRENIFTSFCLKNIVEHNCYVVTKVLFAVLLLTKLFQFLEIFLIQIKSLLCAGFLVVTIDAFKEIILKSSELFDRVSRDFMLNFKLFYVQSFSNFPVVVIIE